jgi:beta-mannosidase
VDALRVPDVRGKLAQAGADAADALLVLGVSASAGGVAYKHSTVFHPATLAEAALRDPGLVLTKPRSGAGKTYTFTVQATKAVAAWVWVDVATTAVQGFWSDNGFWLDKGEKREVVFTVWEDWSKGRWVEGVSVRSVWDNTLE